MLFSGTFWLGVLTGIAIYHGWRMYQAKQSAR